MRKWYRLDNAATIVPSAAHGADTRVFRLTCELKEDADPAILQDPLDRTLSGFPYYRSVLRKGLFWYYLDARELQPKVSEESLPALSPLYFPGRKNLLFRVFYYRKRISLEIFHVLADGTGAFIFFRGLILTYLSLKHGVKIPGSCEENETDEGRTADAFRSFGEETKGLKQLRSMTLSRAYQLKGRMDDNLEAHLLEATVPAHLFLQKAKDFGVSAGVLTVSLYIASAIDVMGPKDRKHPVVISVPVDLRRYYPTKSARNFFGVINVSYDAENFDGNMESILGRVKEIFAENLKPEKIAEVMNSYASLQKNYGIRLVPLLIKDEATRGLNFLASKGMTCTISNLGVMKVPEEADAYIEKLSVFSAAPSEQICLVTFHDRMVFGEVSPYATHDVMRCFFRRIAKMGIPVELSVNEREENA